MDRRLSGTLTVFFVLAVGNSCGVGGAENIWSSFLKKCTEGKQIKNVLYFSTSNNLGPGTIWSKSQTNGFIPVRKLTGAPDDVLNAGAGGSCAGARIQSSSVGLTLGADKVFAVLGANVSSDLKRASRVTVNAPSWRWDDLMLGPYRDWIGLLKQTDPTNAYVRDLERDSLVVGRGVRLVGLTADLEFGREVAGELKAKYPTGINLETAIKGDWKDSLTMRMTVDTLVPVYVAVVLYNWTSEGFQTAGAGKEVDLPEDAKVLSVVPRHE